MTLIRSLSSFLKSEIKVEVKKKKTCFDCFHCKVSAKTKEVRLCFCAKTRKKENHKEPYWIDKPVCKWFDDMSA